MLTWAVIPAKLLDLNHYFRAFDWSNITVQLFVANILNCELLVTVLLLLQIYFFRCSICYSICFVTFDLMIPRVCASTYYRIWTIYFRNHTFVAFVTWRSSGIWTMRFRKPAFVRVSELPSWWNLKTSGGFVAFVNWRSSDIWTMRFRSHDFVRVSELPSYVFPIYRNALLPKFWLRSCFLFTFAEEFELFASEALTSYIFPSSWRTFRHCASCVLPNYFRGGMFLHRSRFASRFLGRTEFSEREQ